MELDIGEQQKEELANLLREFKIVHNLSGRELARRIGMNPATVASWIDKTSYPTPESRHKIARALKMTPVELESRLVNIAVQSSAPLEQVKQEIRAMNRRDFQDVVATVFDRIQHDLARSI